VGHPIVTIVTIGDFVAYSCEIALIDRDVVWGGEWGQPRVAVLDGVHILQGKGNLFWEVLSVC